MKYTLGRRIASMSFPSIHEADKRNKTDPEDRATSNLFGYLGKLSPNVRREFLNEIGMAVSSELKRVELWKTLRSNRKQRREVDALLNFGDTKMLVENKLHSDLDVEQLVDEYELGTTEFGHIELSSITSHSRRPAEVSEVEQRLGIKIRWTNWQKCLETAKNLPKKPETDPASRQNLLELAEYLQTQVNIRQGFQQDDDWHSFHRLIVNTKNLLDSIQRVIKQTGLFDIVESYSPFDEYDSAFSGRWVYTYNVDDESQEAGFWIAVGSIDDLSQIEFAPYEVEERQKLRDLSDKGYSQEKKPWNKGYDYYSKYLQIRQLKTDQYDGQEEEVIDFVKACLTDRFNKGDKVYLRVPEKNLYYEAKILDLEDSKRIRIEITDSDWKGDRKPSTDVAYLIRDDEAEAFLRPERSKTKKSKTPQRTDQKRQKAGAAN